MIQSIDVSKAFGEVKALDRLNCAIEAGSIFGLIGSNGAGKSTLLRLIAGLYKPDAGILTYDGMRIYGDAQMRHEIILIPDRPVFLPQSSLAEMARFYASVYKHWDKERYQELCSIFPLDVNQTMTKMSKGMQRQALLVLALAAQPTLLLMDEAFDGLDPVMRQSLKKYLARDVAERRCTIVIASHNLRELEDVCDKIALLHKGGLVFEHELDSMDLGVYKLQLAFKELPSMDELTALDLKVLHYEAKQSVIHLVLRGEKEALLEKVERLDPLITDLLPLTLEELFIYELEVKGYAVRDLLA